MIAGPILLNRRLWEAAYKHWMVYAQKISITSQWAVEEEELADFELTM